MVRAAVYLDSGYFAKVLKYAFHEPKIDFEDLSDKLCEGCERLRTYFYYCMPYQSHPPTPEERNRYARADSFIYNLKKLNRFEIRLGKLIYVPKLNDYVQKRVDVLLSVDLVRMSWARQIDRAILVTGDTDFVPAVEAAKHAGVVTKIWYCNRPRVTTPDELLFACDERNEITQDLIDSVRI